MQVAQHAETPCDALARCFWAAACPLAPTHMLPDAAALLRSAPPITSHALIAAHPALHSVAAPLPSVFSQIPAEADVAACERALVWPAHGAGAGKPLLHVQLGASHEQGDCARMAAALARLQPKPSIALASDARGLRVVAPLLQHLAALPVVSITLLPSDEGADAQRDVLRKCAPGLRALELRNVMSQDRADRLQRAVAPGPGFAHPALDETTRLLQLHCLALHDNVLCDCDCEQLLFALHVRLKQLRSFSWRSSRHSEARETAAVLEECAAGLVKQSALQSVQIEDTVMPRAAAIVQPWGRIAAQLAHMQGLTRLSFARTFFSHEGMNFQAHFGMFVANAGAHGASALVPAVAGLTLLRELDLSGVECASAGGGGGNLMRDVTAALTRLRHLRALHMSGNALVAGHGVGALPQPACSIAAHLCEACAHLPALTCLALAQCGLKGAAPGATAFFAALAGLTRLQWLDVSRNALCDASALLPLLRLQQLRHLGAHDCQLLRGDFSDLADALRALTAITRLDLRWNDQLTEQQLDACAGQLGLHNDAGDMRAAAQPQ